jgi:hypothetical protein
MLTHRTQNDGLPEIWHSTGVPVFKDFNMRYRKYQRANSRVLLEKLMVPSLSKIFPANNEVHNGVHKSFLPILSQLNPVDGSQFTSLVL